MKTLVVDDDPVTLTLLRDSLTYLGYDVLTATNGREALEAIEANHCRLVICDWIMPVMDGIELCKAIRDNPAGGYIYIVLLTSNGGTTHLVEGYSAGADDFMSKPFEPAELNSRLRTARRILSLESRDVTIFALAKLAESREPNMESHLERTRAYAQSLARDLAAHGQFPDEIDGEFIRLIYLTSPLHDIGKMSIPDSILLKPGRLDDHEFDMMKRHTLQGAQTLDEALKEFPEASFLRMARDLALYHHEKFDGTGYPEGRSGEHIPLVARIFAVADVYDALVCQRVYKNAYRHDIAKKILLKEENAHFDPKVLQAFLRCEDRFRQIASNIAPSTSSDG